MVFLADAGLALLGVGLAGGFLALVAWLVDDPKGRADAMFWEGFAQGHTVGQDERLNQAYTARGITRSDLDALDQWAKTWHRQDDDGR